MKQILKIIILILFILITGTLYCYYNYQFWTYLETDNFETLTEFRGKNIKGLRGTQILVHIKFKPHMIKIDKYAEKNRVELIINQSYRNSEQILNRTIVEPVKLSNHLAGFAIDFNIKYKGIKYFSEDLKRNNLSELPKNVESFINDIRQDMELRWGGDFVREDPVHIDIPINLESRESWLNYYQLCEKDYSNGVLRWKLF